VTSLSPLVPSHADNGIAYVAPRATEILPKRAGKTLGVSKTRNRGWGQGWGVISFHFFAIDLELDSFWQKILLKKL